MSWQIALIENTACIADEDIKSFTKEMFSRQSYVGEIWDNQDQVMEGNVLFFNTDHYEHMDFLRPIHIVTLCKYNAKGCIKFGSLDGDNKGSFWGYKFDGRGSCIELKADLNSIVWEMATS